MSTQYIFFELVIDLTLCLILSNFPPPRLPLICYQFISSGNMAPLVFPWADADAYDAIYGQTEVDGVTFAKFSSTSCGDGN